MLDALAASAFYARFAVKFSRLGWQRRARHFDPQSASFSGQTWVVTGGSGGIGRAIALAAARRGALVRAIARPSAKLDALAQMRSHPGAVDAVAGDLSSMAAIGAIAQRLARQGRIDVLVLNVGVLIDRFERTAEGIERSFATNLLGHFVLCERLREAGALDASSAIISMSSGGMYGARLTLAKLEAQDAQTHHGLAAYAQHKRAQVELTRHWNSLGDGAPRAYAMHPGWVDTDGVRTALPGFKRVFGPILRTPEQGADTALWLAAERPAIEPGGGVWLDRHLDPEHEFGLTRNGASATELVALLRARTNAALDVAPKAA